MKNKSRRERCQDKYSVHTWPQLMKLLPKACLFSIIYSLLWITAP